MNSIPAPQRPPVPNSLPNGPYFGQNAAQNIRAAGPLSVPSDPSLNRMPGNYRPDMPQAEAMQRNNSAPDVGNMQTSASPLKTPAPSGTFINGAPYNQIPANSPYDARPPAGTLNGPVDTQQRLGPQGQFMNRSVSSPPVSGPIAAAPIPGQPPTPSQVRRLSETLNTI